MQKNGSIKIWVFSIFLLLGGISARDASAALLYLDPQEGEHQPGETFGISIRLDPEGECVNAADITVRYPRDIIAAVDVDRSESIFSLWVHAPEINPEAGTITLIGGIPGSYCGRIPGDPGVSNVLTRVIFRIPGFRVGANLADAAALDFDERSQVLLSDGRATPANLRFQGSALRIVDKGQPLTNEWLEQIRSDDTPPELFTVELIHDVQLFDGRYAIAFNTTDKQTGMDHYEVLEADEAGNIAGTFKPAALKTSESPYVLSDQDLHSVLTVKALDKAGNERVVTFKPQGYTALAPKNPVDIGPYVLWGAGAAVVLGILIFIWRWVKRRRLRT